MGLIRGASAENAIVLTDEGIKNPPLRFPDEFVRHKVLDLIGDLALLGKQILGRIVADRAGHAMHTALVSRCCATIRCGKKPRWETLSTHQWRRRKSASAPNLVSRLGRSPLQCRRPFRQ